MTIAAFDIASWPAPTSHDGTGCGTPYPLVNGSERFALSLLAADQISEVQYDSYPGRKFRYADGGAPATPPGKRVARCATSSRPGWRRWTECMTGHAGVEALD